MSLDPSMKAGMQQPTFVSALLFEITLPLKTIRVLDGAGELYFDNQVFRGSDDVFGSIIAVDPLQEQVGTEAPLIRIKMGNKSVASMAVLNDPANQGAPVNIWWAVVNRSNGLIIGEPYLVFGGELDASEIDIDRNESTSTMDIASVWDRLFMDGEGMRLNNAQHQKTWSEQAGSERGFEYVVAIQRDEPWGYDGPRPAIVADVIGGTPATGGGGSGGGGGGTIGGGGQNWGGGGNRWDVDSV